MNQENHKTAAPLHQVVGQLRELLSKATPGPWCCADWCHLECREIGYIGHLELHAPSSPFQRAESEHDARLLVAAVNALPALLAIAEAAQARMETYDKGEDYTGGIRSQEWDNLRTALSLLPNVSVDRAGESAQSKQNQPESGSGPTTCWADSQSARGTI